MSQSQKKYFNSNDARRLIDVYGFALIPVHGVVDGKCTCGNSDCTNVGKHPATLNGLTDATKDMNVLGSLWKKRTGLNVGIATGAVSGVFVIDIDGAIGETELAKHGTLPKTLTTVTGRGRHLFFKHPGKEIKTRKGIFGPDSKVDVRGDGGYVVGPGSNHLSGNIYEWVNPYEVIEDAPLWLVNIVEKEIIASNSLVSSMQAPIPRLIASNRWAESDALDMLSYISPDIGYDEWIKVGMALQSEGFGFTIWDNWSRGSSSKYHQSSMPSHWKSFKPNAGVSFGTLVHMAQDGGWGRSKSIIKDTVNRQNNIIKDTAGLATAEDFTKLINSYAPEKTAPPKTGMFYTKFNDIKSNLECNDFVQGLLGNNQLSVIYGESNCGKTFFMTDLCFHIALGKRWRDRRVDHGGIIYTAMEGSYGLRNRVSAFKQHTGLTDAKFAMVASQVDFLSPEGNIEEFTDLIKKASDDLGNVRMVVVDTLSRALSGGDENSGQDMGMLVYHADRIRYETGAHVSFVHHSGKNKALGARGHSSLRAAVDTEIEISRDEGADYSSIKIVKQREMEMGEDMYFGLERVVLATNAFGEEISSCVVKTIDKDDVVKPLQDRTLTAIQQFVYDAIVNALISTTTVLSPREGTGSVPVISYEAMWYELEKRGYKEMIEPDKAKNATTNIRIALRKAGKIDFTKNWIWLTSYGAD